MRGRDGFSLIEVMVALAVLSIAGLALMRAQSENLRTAMVVEQRALATLAAENLLTTQLLTGPLADRSGRYELAGVEYEWSLEIARTSDPDLVQARLELRPSGETRVLTELVTFRRAGP